jgi:hypothetical protein
VEKRKEENNTLHNSRDECRSLLILGKSDWNLIHFRNNYTKTGNSHLSLSRIESSITEDMISVNEWKSDYLIGLFYHDNLENIPRPLGTPIETHLRLNFRFISHQSFQSVISQIYFKFNCTINRYTIIIFLVALMFDVKKFQDKWMFFFFHQCQPVLDPADRKMYIAAWNRIWERKKTIRFQNVDNDDRIFIFFVFETKMQKRVYDLSEFIGNTNEFVKENERIFFIQIQSFDDVVHQIIVHLEVLVIMKVKRKSVKIY